MNSIIENLIKLFHSDHFNETELFDFAKKNGLEKEDISEIKEMFELIDRTSDKEKELKEYRAKGGTLESFISKEFDRISENHGLSEEEHGIIVEAYQNAAGIAKNKIIEEE